MFESPVPIGLKNRRQVWISRPPTQKRVGVFGISDELRRISRSRWLNPHVDRFSRHLPRSFNDFQNRIAMSVAKIDAFGFATIAQVIQSTGVCISKIRDMDVVSNRRTVRSGIVITED